MVAVTAALARRRTPSTVPGTSGLGAVTLGVAVGLRLSVRLLMLDLVVMLHW
jgi:hypothetical protein